MKKYMIERSKKFDTVVWDIEQVEGFVFSGTLKECREWVKAHGIQVGPSKQ